MSRSRDRANWSRCRSAPIGPFADCFALVGRLLAARQTELHLAAALHPVEPERDQRVTALLDAARELVDFPPMEEQLPIALGLVPELARRRVGADVRADQEELVAEESGVGILQLRPAIAQRLYLRADQGQAGFDALVDVVVVKGPPVLGDVPLG